MRTFFVSIFIVLISACLHAQTKPPISQLSGIKEKLVAIKKGFPQIRKNLVKPDPEDTLTLLLKVKMGDFASRYKLEYGRETLQYRFSYSSNSGTVEDYQAFYRKLLGLLGEVFGDKYELIEYDPKEKEWSATFDEKGSNFKSPTSIAIRLNWYLESSGPTLDLVFFGPKPKT